MSKFEELISRRDPDIGQVLRHLVRARQGDVPYTRRLQKIGRKHRSCAETQCGLSCKYLTLPSVQDFGSPNLRVSPQQRSQMARKWRCLGLQPQKISDSL
jgi:hypothetical protein